jgi:hypothetical protein
MVSVKRRQGFLVISEDTMAIVLDLPLGISALESVVHFSCFVEGKCVFVSDPSLEDAYYVKLSVQ